MNNLYEILGVSADASTLVIRQAFRRLALQLHPDKVGGGADCQKRATEAFQVVKTVADTLLDVRQRELYDVHLEISQVRRSGMISDTYYLWEDFEEVEVEKESPSWRAERISSSTDDVLPSSASLLTFSERYTTSKSRESNTGSPERDAMYNHRQKRGAMRIFQMECRCGGVYEVVIVEEQEEKEKADSCNGPTTSVSDATSNKEAVKRAVGSGEEKRNSVYSENVTGALEGEGVQVGQAKSSAPIDFKTLVNPSLSAANKAQVSPSEHIVECDSCSLVIRVIAKTSNNT